MTSDPVTRYLAARGARLERRERLRPMTAGQLFDASLKVYRKFGWTFLRLTLVPACFCLAGVVFVQDYALPLLTVTRHAGDTTAQLGEAAFALALALLIGGPLFLIGASYTCALVIQLTSGYMLGNDISPIDSEKLARKKFGALIVVALREMLLSSGGIVVGALILGFGSYLSNRPGGSDSGSGMVVIGMLGIISGFGVFLVVLSIHALAPVVLMLEGVGPLKASKRSATLLKGQLSHPSGVPSLLSAILGLCFAGLLEWASLAIISAGLDAGQHLEGVTSGIPYAGVFVSAFALLPPFVTIWTLLPVYAACVTLLYYERRIRLEGLDIEILAAETQKLGAANRFDV